MISITTAAPYSQYHSSQVERGFSIGGFINYHPQEIKAEFTMSEKWYGDTAYYALHKKYASVESDLLGTGYMAIGINDRIELGFTIQFPSDHHIIVFTPFYTTVSLKINAIDIGEKRLFKNIAVSPYFGVGASEGAYFGIAFGTSTLWRPNIKGELTLYPTFSVSTYNEEIGGYDSGLYADITMKELAIPLGIKVTFGRKIKWSCNSGIAYTIPFEKENRIEKEYYTADAKFTQNRIAFTTGLAVHFGNKRTRREFIK